MYHSTQLIKYLLLLLVLTAYGCAQKTTTHVYIDEHIPANNPIINNHVIATSKPKQLTPKRMNDGVYSSVWDGLFAHYALPEVDNERIQKAIKNYLQHPEYIDKIQQRAKPYLHFIVNEIEARGIPGELALLPVVESAFKPNALSKSRASGLWQFMPATGRLFGLKQNWWYDGRNDIYKSTQAAADYLKQLATYFDHDWLLALAAYNAGKGNVRKAIKYNRKHHLPTDYWSLNLPKETMGYVPKLLAIAKILAQAEQYHIRRHNIPNESYFKVVKIDSQLDIILATEMAQIPLNEFLLLNPAFKRTHTAPNESHHLLIQAEKVDTFTQKLATIRQQGRIKLRQHPVKPGENLSIIAKQYATTVTALRQYNHISGSYIRAGQKLLIPMTQDPREPLRKTGKRFYTVKKGDTFWHIARRFAVKSKDIAHWNKLSIKKALQPGQKLIILSKPKRNEGLV